MICQEIPSALCGDPPVLIVGAGPAGIVQALELRRHGVEVTDARRRGGRVRRRFPGARRRRDRRSPRHAPMGIAVRRALGGTSLLWGGRCVPFDEIDFADRPHVPLGGWPLSHDEIRPWYEIGMRYLNAGAAEFSAPLPAVGAMAECRIDRLERWSEQRNLRWLHAEALEGDPGLKIILGAVATGLDIDPVTGRVDGVSVCLPSGRADDDAGARDRARLRRAGDDAVDARRAARPAAPFRRRSTACSAAPIWRISRGASPMWCSAPALPDDAFDFFIDESGRYARRRITIDAASAAAPRPPQHVPPGPTIRCLSDPAHKSAILSLAYLSLATPGLGRLLEPEAIRRKYLEHGVERRRRASRQHPSRPARGGARGGELPLSPLCRGAAAAGLLHPQQGAALRAVLPRRAGAEPGEHRHPRRGARRARHAAPQDRPALQRARRDSVVGGPRDHRPQFARRRARPARIPFPRRRRAARGAGIR